MKLKSKVAGIFLQFKTLVEKLLQKQIISVYTDKGEFNFIKPMFNKVGIQHLQTPPYTPEHNAIAKRRHQSIVETSKTLLHQSNMSLEFRSHAFCTAMYLLKRSPCKLVQKQITI